MIQIDTAEKVALFDALREYARDSSNQEWSIDDDGDYTYAQAPWKNMAWMRVRKTTAGIRINIIANSNVPMSNELYAIYHSRFLQTLMSHFDGLFDSAEVSALGSKSDLI